jgi:hypothetical protein
MKRLKPLLLFLSAGAWLKPGANENPFQNRPNPQLDHFRPPDIVGRMKRQATALLPNLEQILIYLNTRWPHYLCIFMKISFMIVVTVVITWFIASTVHGIQTGAERLWLMSAVKAPGRMALGEIQADINARRYELAKAKIDILVDTWQRFDSEPPTFRGPAIGDIMVAFSKVDTNSIVFHPEPGNPTNRNHP